MNSKEEAEINNESNSICNSFFTCEICIEPVPLNQKFDNTKTSGECSHPFCTDCIAKYIQVKIENDNASEIKCPDTNCNVVLDALSCRSILPAKVFDKWCCMLCESAVLLASSRGGFAHGRAYCPFRECSELVLNECVRYSSSSSNTRTRITRSSCPNCKKLFCFHCMVPWQENHRCSSTGSGGGDVDRNDMLFIEMVKRKKWTRCPTCNRYVARISGCAHMTCRCKTQFCYRCGNISSGICVCKTAEGNYRRMAIICLIFVIMLFAFIFVVSLFVPVGRASGRIRGDRP